MKMSKEQEKEIQYEEKKTWRRRVMDYLAITLASAIYAVAVSLFLDPNSLAPGGVTGISIILNRITGVETGTWMFAINIPILVLGMWKFGLKFILSTLYCTWVTSCFTNLLGLIFKAGATSGGTDILIKLFRLRVPHLKTGVLFLITDTVIVSISAFVFKNIDTALYAGLVVLVNSLLLDVVLYGRDGAKMLFIISDNPQNIVKRLLEDLDIGATYISGRGAYSGKEKQIVLCVVKKHLFPKAEEVVRQEEPGAFMIVTSATEIYGEGYKSIFSQKL